MAKKGNRQTIYLRNKETGEEIQTVKNRINDTEKLTLKKYSPKLKKHLVFTEIKKSFNEKK